MKLRGPKVKTDKTVKTTERALKQWRKNVAHLLLTGRKRTQCIAERIKAQNRQLDSSTVRLSSSRVALVRKLAAKRGVTMREMLEHMVDKYIS